MMRFKLTVTAFAWLVAWVLLTALLSNCAPAAPVPTAGPFCTAPRVYLLEDGKLVVGSRVAPCWTLRPVQEV